MEKYRGTKMVLAYAAAKGQDYTTEDGVTFRAEDVARDQMGINTTTDPEWRALVARFSA